MGQLPIPALLLLVAAFALPVFAATVPPLVDLPAHVGRYRVRLDLNASPFLHHWYDFHWRLVPNLGVDLIVQALAPALGLERTVKLIAASIPPLTAAGFLWTAKEAHGRIPAPSYFALPLAYNYAFQFGFLNFCLSMAFAFLAFALWLRLGRTSRQRCRAAIFVPLGMLIWLTHIYGWAALALLCFIAEAAGSEPVSDGSAHWPLRLGRAAIGVLPLAAPVLLSLFWRAEGGAPTSRWLAIDVTAGWIVSILRDRWIVWDLLSALLIFSVIAAAIRFRRQFSFDRIVGWGAAALWLACLLLPQKLFGSGYAAGRIAPYATALTILAISPKERLGERARQWILCGALVFCVARLCGSVLSYALYGNELNRELLALQALPRGSTMLAFVESRCDWSNPRVAHLPSYAIARRESFSNDQWQIAGGQLLSVTYDQAGKFKADPSSVVEDVGSCAQAERPLRSALSHVPWHAFEYLWLIDVPKPLWPHEAAWTPVWQSRDSVLLRRK